jgi:hypothetical protein
MIDGLLIISGILASRTSTGQIYLQNAVLLVPKAARAGSSKTKTTNIKYFINSSLLSFSCKPIFGEGSL